MLSIRSLKMLNSVQGTVQSIPISNKLYVVIWIAGIDPGNTQPILPSSLLKIYFIGAVKNVKKKKKVFRLSSGLPNSSCQTSVLTFQLSHFPVRPENTYTLYLADGWQVISGYRVAQNHQNFSLVNSVKTFRPIASKLLYLQMGCLIQFSNP